MANMLIKESQGGEDGGVIEKISFELLKGLSNIFLASTISSADSSDDTNKETAKVRLFISHITPYSYPSRSAVNIEPAIYNGHQPYPWGRPSREGRLGSWTQGVGGW